MARQLRQARAVLRAATDYLRHDLPEIVFPSSIPTPPGMDAPEARTPRREFGALFLRMCRRYAETWDAKKMRAERAARDAQHATVQERRREEEGPTLGEEFAAAAKGGATALKPFLANLYQTRARAYRHTVQQFVEGYKAGFQGAMRPDVPPHVAEEMEAARTAAAAGASGDSEAPPGSKAAAGSEAATREVGQPQASSAAATEGGGLVAACSPQQAAQQAEVDLDAVQAGQAAPSAAEKAPSQAAEAAVSQGLGAATARPPTQAATAAAAAPVAPPAEQAQPAGDSTTAPHGARPAAAKRRASKARQLKASGTVAAASLEPAVMPKKQRERLVSSGTRAGGRAVSAAHSVADEQQ